MASSWMNGLTKVIIQKGHALATPYRLASQLDLDLLNLAEQAIRFVAIHRRMTQGTRGETGQRWCERIWTVVQTCAQQGLSVFEFLCAAVDAHFKGNPAPSLVPSG